MHKIYYNCLLLDLKRIILNNCVRERIIVIVIIITCYYIDIRFRLPCNQTKDLARYIQKLPIASNPPNLALFRHFSVVLHLILQIIFEHFDFESTINHREYHKPPILPNPQTILREKQRERCHYI